MKRVEFGMIWRMYGKQTMEVPDEITTIQQVRDYLRAHWDEIPLPNDGDYDPDSDELDEVEEISFI